MEKKQKYSLLPEIIPGAKPKVLLVGNGLNLSFPGCKKTDKIIQDEWETAYGRKIPDRNDPTHPHSIWKLPFPMEAVVASKDHVQDCMTKIAEDLKNISVEDKQKNMITAMLDLNFDAILTTNYSLEIEKSSIPNYSERRVQLQYRNTTEPFAAQKRLGIFQYTEIPYGNNPSLWHIHGTVMRKDSMIMGPLYYGKLLSEVIDRAHNVKKVCMAAKRKGFTYRPLSWIDYFLIGDVYITSFSLDYSETDIWWLLSYKRLAFPETKVFFYEPRITPDKQLLLNCYDVEMPGVFFDDAEGDDKYINYTYNVFDDIKKRI